MKCSDPNGTSILYSLLPSLRDYFGKGVEKLSELKAVDNYKGRVFSGQSRVITHVNIQYL